MKAKSTRQSAGLYLAALVGGLAGGGWLGWLTNHEGRLSLGIGVP